jgi:hypothetical protein
MSITELNDLGAMRAAFGLERDIAQAFRTLFGRRFSLFFFLQPLIESIHRQYYEEVDGGSDKDEGDKVIEEIAVEKITPVQSEFKIGEVVRFGDSGDDRGE